jgi:energy-coupling factor transport system substrate-specific component
MTYLERLLPTSRRIAYIGMLTSLAIILRIIKHMIIGPIQFINFPAAFTIIGSCLLGPITGFIIGFSSYFISDIMIGLPGLWTFVNGFLMGFFGIINGLIWGRNKNYNKIGIAISSYIILFSFDILSSWILYILIGFDWIYALIISIIGLFLPVAGGFLYAVGPITEFITVLLIISIIHIIRKNNIFRIL